MQNVCPRRVNRLKYRDHNLNEWHFPQLHLPESNRSYWEEVQWEAITRLRASFVFLVGEWAQDVFISWLKDGRLNATQISIPWQDNAKPACWFQYIESGELLRIIFPSVHPEAFWRYRTYDDGLTSNKLEIVSFRERFMDLVNIYMTGNVANPAFLSSSKVFRQYTLGLFIKPSTFNDINH